MKLIKPVTLAPCTLVSISQSALNGIQILSQGYTFSISEIVGGSHSENSKHNLGLAIDVNMVNGVRVVVMNSTQVENFREAAFDSGAIVVYDPFHDTSDNAHSNHFHIQW
jgi:hypothetical protein